MSDKERDQRFSTLQMIASELRVSVSTVSRVLNSTPESARRAASKKTADRIRALAQELGYTPNPHARNLRARRSREIGVLVPRVSDLVLATIYEGIQEEAAEHDLQSFVLSTFDDAETHNRALATLERRRVDGVILGDGRLDDAGFDVPSVPAVAVSRRDPHIISITCDDLLGGRLAADHLFELGHTDVAILSGQPYASTGLDRTAGFVERWREHGLEVPGARIVNCSFDTRGGRAAIDELGGLLSHVTAIFAVNDFTAIGAMGALRQRGINVGDDIGLIGFNDVSLAADLPIPLTSVRSPMTELGIHALGALISVMDGEPVESVRLQPELHARQSTLGSARALGVPS